MATKESKRRDIHVGASAEVSANARLKLGASALVSTQTQECRERIANDESHLHSSFEVGDVAHQGDLIIVGISGLPASACPRKNRQLADGDTQGSRHVLERGDLFDADSRETARMINAATGCEVDSKYVGPVFISPENPTADDLTHPEHGNQGFPGSRVCAVVFQRNLEAEKREARVLD
jgi:hypothetical protein